MHQRVHPPLAGGSAGTVDGPPRWPIDGAIDQESMPSLVLYLEEAGGSRGVVGWDGTCHMYNGYKTDLSSVTPAPLSAPGDLRFCNSGELVRRAPLDALPERNN